VRFSLSLHEKAALVFIVSRASPVLRWRGDCDEYLRPGLRKEIISTYLPVFSRRQVSDLGQSLDTPLGLDYLSKSELPAVSGRSSRQRPRAEQAIEAAAGAGGRGEGRRPRNSSRGFGWPQDSRHI
jgi:hypothetical protein